MHAIPPSPHSHAGNMLLLLLLLRESKMSFNIEIRKTRVANGGLRVGDMREIDASHRLRRFPSSRHLHHITSYAKACYPPPPPRSTRSGSSVYGPFVSYTTTTHTIRTYRPQQHIPHIPASGVFTFLPGYIWFRGAVRCGHWTLDNASLRQTDRQTGEESEKRSWNRTSSRGGGGCGGGLHIYREGVPFTGITI